MQHKRRSVRVTFALACLAAVTTAPRLGETEPDADAPPHPVATESPASPHLPAASRPRDLDATPIQQAVEKLDAGVKQWGATAGVLVLDLSTGRAIASLNEHSPLNPASNAKLATAAVALRLLGGQHRYLTGLYGKVVGDRADEIVLRGQGDPTLATKDLWELANQLRAAGIRRVGTVAVDQGYFDDHYVPPAFDQQPQEWSSFRAPVAAVSLNENTVTFVVRPGALGKEASVSVDPPGFVDITGAVLTKVRGSPEKVTLSLEPKDSRLAVRLGGHLPEGSRTVRVVKRVDDPRLLAGYALRAVLKDVGIEVGKTVRPGGNRVTSLLAAHRSAPLAEILSSLGKESDNFYAEMVFKAIGAEKKERPGTAEGAASVVMDTLRELGAWEAGVVAKNGSGLFDANRTTPWALVALLRTAHADPSISAEYIAQLAVGGVDGTLRSRLRPWAGKRVIRAKTGTLNDVATLSGYVLAPPGRSPLAFAILVNGLGGKVSSARTLIDQVVDAAARELWRE